MSNIAMGTIFVNGFAERQVHTDHSTSYVPKKEITKETQSSFSFCFKFAQFTQFYTEYGRNSKNVTIKVKKKLATITISGYNFMILSYIFSIEREIVEKLRIGHF